MIHFPMGNGLLGCDFTKEEKCQKAIFGTNSTFVVYRDLIKTMSHQNHMGSWENNVDTQFKVYIAMNVMAWYRFTENHYWSMQIYFLK